MHMGKSLDISCVVFRRNYDKLWYYQNFEKIYYSETIYFIYNYLYNGFDISLLDSYTSVESLRKGIQKHHLEEFFSEDGYIKKETIPMKYIINENSTIRKFHHNPLI